MGFLELRVHGVHGTSPGSMLGLGDSEVGQVAGDGVTGLYRSKSGELPLRTLKILGPDGKPKDEVAVEAYSWGSLTSGVRGALGWLRRVGWLLLLPFALANLAYWARLHVGEDGRKARWGAKLVRISGLSLTLFMVLMPCVVAIDMVGWQCYRDGVPRCSNLPGQLGFLADWTAPQRLLLTSVVPVLLVGLLWLLSRQTLNSYEAVGPEYAVADTSDVPVTTALPVLRRPYLWSAAMRTRRLQRLHLATALAAVVVFVDAQVLHAVTGKVNKLTLPWVGWRLVPVDWVVMGSLALAGAVVLLGAVLVTFDHQHDLEYRGAASSSGVTAPPPTYRRAFRRIERALVLLAGLAFVAQAWALYRYRGGFDQSSEEYFGHNLWFVALFLLLTVLHLTVFAGERMGAVTMVAGVVATALVAAAVGVMLWVDQDAEKADKQWLLWCALGLVALWWLALVLWHYKYGSAGNGDKAWGGGGASVLLAAAAWIGLLFTSSVVTAAADWVNGPDRSVADLVTSTEEDDVSPRSYAAGGDVTLRGARFAISDKQVVVYSGTITADRFTEVGRGSPVALRIGTTPVRSPFAVRLPKDGDIAVEQSCLVDLGQRKGSCSASSRGYHEAAEIHPGSRRLSVVDEVNRPHGFLSTAPAKGKVTLQPLERIETPIVVPQVLVWTPLGQLLWLILVVLALGACVGVYSATAGSQIKDGLPLVGGDPPDGDIPERDRLACRARRRTAGLAHRAEALLDVAGLVTAPVALTITVCALTGDAPWDREHLGWTRGVATTAMYLMVLTAGGLILLGSYIRRSESARKAVGVIWDLATFWPRAAHPLAPPCYAERVVPELHTRTRWALDAPPASPDPAVPNQVILSGHSQGSLIVVSMASRLRDEDLARVRVITYGSQIRALYGRVFPRVFGADDIGYNRTLLPPRLRSGFPDIGFEQAPQPDPAAAGSLRQRLESAGGSWISLFRRTDPLGYRVFSDSDSSLDRPVPEVPPDGSGDPGPVVRAHSDYQHTGTYREVVCGWTGERPYEDEHPPDGIIDVPVFPRS